MEQISGENVETFAEFESNYESHAVKFQQAEDEWQRMTTMVADQFHHLNDVGLTRATEQRGQFTDSFCFVAD